MGGDHERLLRLGGEFGCRAGCDHWRHLGVLDDDPDLGRGGEVVYRLHFPPGQLPPNDAFWSLTATDTVGYIVSNPIGRSSVDDHSGLVTNADGSVDILLQSQEPSGPAQNWLPIPTGRFKLMLRAYLPGVPIVDGSYELPPVVQVS